MHIPVLGGMGNHRTGQVPKRGWARRKWGNARCHDDAACFPRFAVLQGEPEAGYIWHDRGHSTLVYIRGGVQFEPPTVLHESLHRHWCADTLTALGPVIVKRQLAPWIRNVRGHV